ncbi:MAG: ABC transporter permease [Lachnospiraceae bacterium]|nr:ABC transporter permease [Lachnospiraceae bacterium]MCI9283424.1 ABC transporter permease [Lachnospiraceae bacterium]
MPKQIAKKLIWLILEMFLLSILVFYLARQAPGDPLQSFYGDAMESMTEVEREAARERLGLNDGFFVQYVRWFIHALQGDFGLSYQYKMPVLAVMKSRIGNTLLLGGIAYILIFVLATMLAIVCAFYEGRLPDRLICRIGTIFYYIPGFWLGVVLVLVFSINLRWLPSSGAYDVGMQKNLGNRIWHLILPLTVMIASHLWYYACMIRNKLLDEMQKDYALFARAKGCSRIEILWKHCLRNVMPAIVNLMAISISHITGGTVVAEAVFNYPGVGNLAVESAKYHDYNLLMVNVLLTGLMVFVGGFVAQIVNEKIDPRIKETGVIKW